MITVTFEPEARLDPNQLESAVREVDFTPTGVKVWLGGRLAPEPLDLDGHQGASWLVAEGSGQRFLLVADDQAGLEALETLRAADPGSLTVFGRATRAEGTDRVTVHLEGTERSE